MVDKRKIAVLGAGTTGAGITAQYAMYGYEVSLYSRKEKTLSRARKTAEKSLKLLEDEHLLPGTDAATAAGRISYTTVLEEAVKEPGTW